MRAGSGRGSGHQPCAELGLSEHSIRCNLQYKQFAPVLDGHLAIALANDSATAACYKAADEAMSGYTNVGRCVYFRTPIEGLTGTQIGGHIFY